MRSEADGRSTDRDSEATPESEFRREAPADLVGSVVREDLRGSVVWEGLRRPLIAPEPAEDRTTLVVDLAVAFNEFVLDLKVFVLELKELVLASREVRYLLRYSCLIS